MSARRSSRAFAGAAVIAALGFAFVSCEVAPAAGLALSLEAPKGILDQATAVKLSVFDAKGFTCDAMGNVGTIPSSAQVFQLKNTGCDAAGDWCTSITLPEDKTTKMFAVQVTNASGILGQGCAQAAISQNPLAVSIKVVRYIPPPCCNNGTLETGELCDNGMAGGASQCSTIAPDEACASNCTTNEIAVDRAMGGPAPAPGTKSNVSLAFSGGSGQLANALRAAFSDTGATSNSGDVDVRYLTADVTTVTTPSLLSSPLKLPLACSNPSGAGQARTQNAPALAPLSEPVAVAYLSDETVPGQFNLYATTLDGNGRAENAAQQVNTTANAVTTPAVAAGPGGALIVWAQNGSLFGRTFDGSNLGASVINLGSGSAPRVAASSKGFVVVFAGSGGADPDGIYYETVSTTGTVGTPTIVNAKTSGVQDQPAIASFSDGRFAVAFRSGGDVFFQRYDANGTATTGDQDAPFETTNPGNETTPAIASGTSPTQGDFYAVAWAASSGDVLGRLAGATSGFLFNQVNGQNTDFLVNIQGETGTRANPAIAIGGTGYIVFGWDDSSAGNPGVFVRRFPLPQ